MVACSWILVMSGFIILWVFRVGLDFSEVKLRTCIVETRRSYRRKVPRANEGKRIIKKYNYKMYVHGNLLAIGHFISSFPFCANIFVLTWKKKKQITIIRFLLPLRRRNTKSVVRKSSFCRVLPSPPARHASFFLTNITLVSLIISHRKH